MATANSWAAPFDLEDLKEATLERPKVAIKVGFGADKLESKEFKPNPSNIIAVEPKGESKVLDPRYSQGWRQKIKNFAQKYLGLKHVGDVDWPAYVEAEITGLDGIETIQFNSAEQLEQIAQKYQLSEKQKARLANALAGAKVFPKATDINYLGSQFLEFDVLDEDGLETIVCEKYERAFDGLTNSKKLRKAFAKNSKLNSMREKYQLFNKRVLDFALEQLRVEPGETHNVVTYQNSGKLFDHYNLNMPELAGLMEEDGLSHANAMEKARNVLSQTKKYTPKQAGPLIIAISATKDFYNSMSKLMDANFHNHTAGILAVDQFIKPNGEEINNKIRKKFDKIDGIEKYRNGWSNFLAKHSVSREGRDYINRIFDKLGRKKTKLNEQIGVLARLYDWKGYVADLKDREQEVAELYRTIKGSEPEGKKREADLKLLDNQITALNKEYGYIEDKILPHYDADLADRKDLLKKHEAMLPTAEILRIPGMLDFWKAYLSGEEIAVTKAHDAEVAVHKYFVKQSPHVEPKAQAALYCGEKEATSPFGAKDKEQLENIHGLKELPNSLENIVQLDAAKRKILGDEETSYIATDITQECEPGKQRVRYYDDRSKQINASVAQIRKLRKGMQKEGLTKEKKREIYDRLELAYENIAHQKELAAADNFKWKHAGKISKQKVYGDEVVKEKYCENAEQKSASKHAVAASPSDMVEKRNESIEDMFDFEKNEAANLAPRKFYRTMRQDGITYGADLEDDALHFKNNVMISNNMNKKSAGKFLITYDLLRTQLCSDDVASEYIGLMKAVVAAEKNYEQNPKDNQTGLALADARKDFNNFRKNLPHPDLVVLSYTPAEYGQNINGEEVKTQYGSNYTIYLFKDGKQIASTYADVSQFDKLLHTYAFCERGMADFEPTKEGQTQRKA